MYKVFRSFYARLSFIFLIIILIFGMASLFITFSATGHLFDEVEQLLNRDYAKSIAEELQPIVEDGFSEEKVKNAIHYMMVLNPMVEIYIIDGKGDILSYFTSPGERIIKRNIDIVPLNKFIKSKGLESIYGEDPRMPNRQKPFSAAQLVMGVRRGFVYVILRGQSYDQYLRMIGNNYYLRSVFTTFLFALIITLIAGFSIFFFLTRRLQKLGLAVNEYQRGNYKYRLNIHGSDELGVLATAFNDMASSIENSVDKLQDAEKQRGDLITNISHDLRSPLTSIRGHIETMLLKNIQLNGKEGRDFLEISLKNISSLQKLVEELFDLARFEAKQVKAIKERFNLAELVQDIMLKLKPVSDLYGINIFMHHDDDHPVINADIGMIERVISNLLENALKNTPEGGRIDLNVSSLTDSIELSVSDTGSGINEEDMPHIFERFYRADKSRNRGNPGTGLGLAIVKEIIDLHNGTIEVQSPTGNGAVFVITLPC